MFRRFSKKSTIVALTVVAALAVAGGAIAYFTNAGSGGGTASVGTSSGITLAGTSSGPLYPGGAPATATVLVTNPGSGSQYVAAVHLVSVAIDKTNTVYTTASPAQQATWNACDTTVGAPSLTGPADPAFSMPDFTVGKTLTRSGTTGDHTTVTGPLQMNDTGVAQDNCQGAPLALTFSSN
jgi:hypothetical protein